VRTRIRRSPTETAAETRTWLAPIAH
jgi:hypothetical protein